MASELGGVWRTIGGRRVFIKDGQDLASAMKESGKFKRKQKEDHTFKMNDEEKKKYEEVGKKIDNLTKEIEEKNKEDIKIKSKNDINKINEKFSIDYFKQRGVEIKDTVPEGYIKLEGATTAPKGYEWYSNGKSRFGGEYEHVLVKKSGSNNMPNKELGKYASVKHEGFGDYNKDNIPVYNNKIDYTGDFGRNANLSSLSNDELREAIKIQQQKLDDAKSERIGDQRTRNGRMDKIFNTAKRQQYEEGVKKLKEEAVRRENDKHPQYKGTNYEVKYYSVEDATKDPNSAMNQYIRNEKQKKAYKKYLKQHPNSELSFNEFKDLK